MVKGLESIMLGGESAKKLADFYRDAVGLKQKSVNKMGENGEEVYEFGLGNATLYIMDHSEVKGKGKDPSRVMFNLEVDDVEKEVERLKKAEVKIVQDVYHIEGYGLIATFEDVDGNYFQLVKTRE